MTRRIDGQLLAVVVGLALWLVLAVQAVGIWVHPHEGQTLKQQCASLDLRASR
jgi:hypothetical protein